MAIEAIEAMAIETEKAKSDIGTEAFQLLIGRPATSLWGRLSPRLKLCESSTPEFGDIRKLRWNGLNRDVGLSPAI